MSCVASIENFQFPRKVTLELTVELELLQKP